MGTYVSAPFASTNDLEISLAVFLCLLELTRESMHIHPRFPCCSYSCGTAEAS